MTEETDGGRRFRIASVTIDERLPGRRLPEVEEEHARAVFDLVEANDFRLLDGTPGPYDLHLSIAERKVHLDIAVPGEDEPRSVVVSIAPLGRTIREYMVICESYYDAIRNLPPARIETIDMARRALHDEGAEQLRKALGDRVEVDHDTARKLFTLVCVLRLKP